MDNFDILFDPEYLHDAVDIRGRRESLLIEQLRTMLLIRFAEEKIADMAAAGTIGCPCHLGIGQEAVAVGVSQHLRAGDRLFGAHRSHSHFLAAGGSAYSLFAEVLGRADGCSGGMGGSMHLYDRENGFYGAVPIVAASIPIATGAALAAKMDGGGSVAVCFFGDGAAEEGVFHESLNLASVMGLPAIFVCENNLFASHMHIRQRQPEMLISRYAASHCLPGVPVDGNDVTAVSEAVSTAFERARGGGGPSLIEAVTYRWRGHVGPSEDMDVGIKRSEDLSRWKQRDPINRLASALMNAKMLSIDEMEELQAGTRLLIEDAWRRALNAEPPDESTLTGLVYYSENEANAQAKV